MPPSLDAIPKGNTCHGVNRAVIEHLQAIDRHWTGKRLLDLPCGAGVLLGVLRTFFPEATIRGADLQPPPGWASDEVAQVDASRPFQIFAEKPFDAILSVSGIMEFHNTRQFFETCRRHLAPDGTLLVTNDNLLTVRDRFAFLFLGRTRLFRLFAPPERATWQPIPVSSLVRSLHDAGFRIKSIRYVSARAKDWAFLPLALALWPLQWLQRRREPGSTSPELRRQMSPFTCLICRHYVVICSIREDAAPLPASRA